MQLLGFFLVLIVVAVGFMEREMGQVRSFDPHAFFMILGGCISAVMISSSFKVAVSSLSVLREFVPGLNFYTKETTAIAGNFEEVYGLYRDGQRAEAIQKSEKQNSGAVAEFMKAVVARDSALSIEKAFHDLKSAEIEKLQPVYKNWEMLAKLSPAFGMVGTITGMIQLFKALGNEDSNIGAAMSLALLATLYGIAFSAGVAGPISHRLQTLLDERLGLLDRMELAARQLAGSGSSVSSLLKGGQ